MASPGTGHLNLMGRYSIFMLDSLPFLLSISTVLGFLAGIGVGGGSLLMLWLTISAGISHHEARSINLLFFLPAAFISCWFRRRQGLLKIKTVLPAIVAGCTAAGLSSWLSTVLDTALIQKLFGGLLLITGIRELLYKEKGIR